MADISKIKVGNTTFDIKAAKADQLTTARTFTGEGDVATSFTTDGSGNVEFSSYITNTSIVKNGVNTAPYARIISSNEINVSFWDVGLLLLITEDYVGGGQGIAYVTFRTNSVSIGAEANLNIYWLMRYNIEPDRLQVGIVKASGKSYFDVFYKTIQGYGCCTIRVLGGNRIGVKALSTLKVYQSTVVEKADGTATNCYKSINGTEAGAAAFDCRGGTQYDQIITAEDASVVSTAKNDYLSQEITSTYLKNIEASGTTLTLTKGDGTTSTIQTQDTQYRTATQSAAGLMSIGDKTTVDKLSVLNADVLGKITAKNLSVVDTVSTRISLSYDHAEYDTTTVTLKADNSSPEEFIGIQAMYFITMTNYQDMEGMNISGKNYNRYYSQGEIITPTSIEISGKKGESYMTRYGNTDYTYNRNTSITCTFDLTEIIESLKDITFGEGASATLVVTASFRNKLVDSWEELSDF